MSTPPASAGAATDGEAIRPFSINVPEAELTELRRRINATKWPERETVADQSQGVQLATIQKCTLLRDRIRLAQDRDEDERPAAVRNSFQKRFAHASDHCANSGTGSPDSGLLVMTPVLNLIRDCQITHRFNWGIFEGGTV